MFTYEAHDHTIVADGQVQHSRALLVAIANARQYGNGALIAPHARIDDGKLDVVVVDARPPWQTLLQVPKLFSGTIGPRAGVTMRAAATVEITSSKPVMYHVDGEPFVGGASLSRVLTRRRCTCRCRPFDESLDSHGWVRRIRRSDWRVGT